MDSPAHEERLAAGIRNDYSLIFGFLSARHLKNGGVDEAMKKRIIIDSPFLDERLAFTEEQIRKGKELQKHFERLKKDGSITALESQDIFAF